VSEAGNRKMGKVYIYGLYCCILLKILDTVVAGEYCQEIPANKPWEKVSGPPILPPHLLQVILNKDTPLSVSNDILFVIAEYCLG
jgi:hypothetical protein